MKYKPICQLVVAAAALSTFPFGCSHSIPQAPRIQPVKKIIEAHITMPSDSLDPVYRDLHAPRSVFNLYRTGGYATLWTHAPEKIALSDSLIRFIKRSKYYGLKSGWYHIQEIDLVIRSKDRESAQRLDALLTDAFLTLGHDLRFGRTNTHDGLDTTSVRPLFPLKSIEGYFDALEPKHFAYQKLKAALRYKLDSLQIANPLFDPDNIAIPPGATYGKIQTLQINMERWRLERAALEEDRIFINIPSYILKVVENDSVVFQSKIIVGAKDTPTPELSGVIDCIVTFPYWYVPRKIAVKEYLPVIRRDTSFLRKNQFDVLSRRGLVLRSDSIPWEDFDEDYFPVTLRQREGHENSLGLLKFVFDNPFAIFLHDTNAKKLFRRKDRALSHGCIRVEKANELAHYMLTGNPNKRSALLEKYLNAKERHSISIPTPIPIHIRYFTCEIVNNNVIFLEDIYKKDPQLLDAFNNAAIERL